MANGEIVPEMVPPELSVRPPGSPPALIDHVYPLPVPPLAVRVVVVYGMPGTPVGSEAVVTVSGGFTVRVNCWVVLLVPLSCTWTVKVWVVALVASVPEMVPAELRVRLEGSWPDAIDHV